MRWQLVIALVVFTGCGDKKSSRLENKDWDPDEQPGVAIADGTAQGPYVPPCDSHQTCLKMCKPCELAACDPKAAMACFELGDGFMKGRAPRIDVAAAAKYLDRACERGVMCACSGAALHFQDGRGVPRDVSRAVKLYQRACDADQGIGCFNLGLMYDEGNGVDTDAKRAKELFLRAEKLYGPACAAGDLRWCVNHGVLYMQGYGVERDAARAKSIYDDACKRGDGQSCVNSVLMALESGDQQIDVRIAKLEQVCSGGEPLACGVLGQMIGRGAFGIDKNTNRAVELMTAACNNGIRQSCITLASMYALGDDVPADPKKYKTFAVLGCELGESSGCMMLGMRAIDLVKLGKPTDDIKYLEQACMIGDPEGCGWMGFLHMSGNGLPKDAAKAKGYFSDACRLGFMKACIELLDAGHELPLPSDRAQYAYEAACRAGIKLGCDRRAAGGLPTAP